MKSEALAMVFNEVEQPFLPMTVDLPSPNEGGTIVEISYTTICTSDLHSFFGRRGAPSPSVLGHLSYAIKFLEVRQSMHPFESLVETEYHLSELSDAFKAANDPGIQDWNHT